MLKRLSLIMATFNRAEQLKTALLSVVMQSADPQLWECVVVNNNSTDSTDEAFAQIAAEYPNITLRVVHESKQGLSHARNCGFSASVGEVVVFIDDDEIFVEGFVQAYLDFFESNPSVSVAGGAYIPRYEGGRPRWMSGIVEAPIAFPLDLGSVDRVFPSSLIPGGGNMALRRSVVGRVLGDKRVVELFDPQLGRCGTTLLGGEEVELLSRLRGVGEPIWWVAQARMYHLIPAEKLEMSYLKNLWFNIGVSQRRRSMVDGRHSTLYLRETAKWVASIIIALYLFVTFRPSKSRYILLMRRGITRGILYQG